MAGRPGQTNSNRKPQRRKGTVGGLLILAEIAIAIVAVPYILKVLSDVGSVPDGFIKLLMFQDPRSILVALALIALAVIPGLAATKAQGGFDR